MKGLSALFLLTAVDWTALAFQSTSPLSGWVRPTTPQVSKDRRKPQGIESALQRNAPAISITTHNKDRKATSLHAVAPTLAVGLAAIPKTLSVITTPLMTFFRLFAKDMRSLTTRQWVWWTLTLAIGYALGRIPPFWKRYTNVMDIPRSLYSDRVLWGRAVSVSDGDTIRFLHQPTRWHPKALRKEKQEKASETALPVRICTIDTPETPKFGKSGQPFGLEAKEALRALLGNGRIGLKILQPDQYGRAVGEVFVPSQFPFVGRPTMVDEFMLRKGMAEVYTGGGAVYGPLGVDAYLKLQEEAKEKKLGIWSQGKRESAAEYKRRTKG